MEIVKSIPIRVDFNLSNVPVNGWGIYKHPDRSCVYKEAKCVKGFNYVNNEILSSQMNYYRTILAA